MLNRVARSVVESLRGLHATHVFVRALPKGRPQPVTKMYNTAWKSARERTAQKWAERHSERAPEGFRKIRVHDFKHTFGRLLPPQPALPFEVSIQPTSVCHEKARFSSSRCRTVVARSVSLPAADNC